jgi:translation initiation factor 1
VSKLLHEGIDQASLDSFNSREILPKTRCDCRGISPQSQTVRLVVEKRKKGKVVTALRGLSAEGNNLPDLLRQLKSACGAGGTIKDDVIELQGDHLKRAGEILAEVGYRVRT